MGTDDRKPLTYEIRTPENARSLTLTIRCCLCRKPLLEGSNGWCEECQEYPINVHPVRFDESNHPVNADGYCRECDDFVLTELIPGKRKWVDTRIVPRRLTRDQLTALLREVSKVVSGPGWPEKVVPLNRRWIPRTWKRMHLDVVGNTPNGDEIVIPRETPAP